MKIAKTLLGLAIWIVLGFLLNCLCVGIGISMYFLLNYMPWYTIVLGTLGGCLAIYMYMIKPGE